MFKYKPIQNQLIEERRRREMLASRLSQTNADLEYIAMMCDVELETGIQSGEVSENEQV